MFEKKFEQALGPSLDRIIFKYPKILGLRKWVLNSIWKVAAVWVN